MMNRWLCGLAGSVLAGVAVAAPPNGERAGEIEYLLRHDCGSCHGMRLAGGLGPALTPEALADLDADYLAAVILHGRPGTAMPPWRGLLTPDEAYWLAEQLVNGETR